MENQNQDYINLLIKRHKEQLERVRKYNHEHALEINKKSRENFQKIKADPEKYKVYLEAKRKQYHDKKKKNKVLEIIGSVESVES
jgi:hypothetical protein